MDNRTPSSKDAVADALKKLLEADPSLRETILGSLTQKDDTASTESVLSSPARTWDGGSGSSSVESEGEAVAPCSKYVPPPPGLEHDTTTPAADVSPDDLAAVPFATPVQCAPPPMDKASKDLQAAIANLQVAADAFQQEQKRVQEERAQQQSPYMAQVVQALVRQQQEEQQAQAVAHAAGLAAAQAATKLAESLTKPTPQTMNPFEKQRSALSGSAPAFSPLSSSAPAYVPAAATAPCPQAWQAAATPTPCWSNAPQMFPTAGAFTPQDPMQLLLQAMASGAPPVPLQHQQWESSVTAPAAKPWAPAKPVGVARNALESQSKGNDNIAEEDKEDTLRTHLQELEQKDPDRVIIVRKINRLGFESPEILTRHYCQYGIVEDVLVSHSHVRCQNQNATTRLRPSGLGFIVMQRVEDAQAIHAQGEHQMVQGAQIRLYPFKKRIALADGL